MRGLSVWPACTLLNVARSALHYESVKAVKDAPVLASTGNSNCPVPVFWLSAHPFVSGSPGPSDEHWTCLAALEPVWTASTEEKTAAQDCKRSPPAAVALDGESDMDL